MPGERSRYYQGGSTSIGYIRCEVCGDLSHGRHLCDACLELVEAHLRGFHAHLVPDCPECLLIVE